MNRTLSLGFEWQVALRFLREGRSQTILIIVGVASGVAVIAYISALISGLQGNTLAKTLGTQPHISIRAQDDIVLPAMQLKPGAIALSDTQPRAQSVKTVNNWQAMVALLEADADIAVVSPMVVGSGLALRGESSLAISLSGVDLDRHDRIIGLKSRVVRGEARLAPGDAIIGIELAQDLGVQPGDRITIRTGAVSDLVRVSALIDLGVRELNRRTVIVPLRTAQNLLSLPGGVSNLDIGLRDVWQAQQVAKRLQSQWPLKIESWQEINAQLVTALNAQSISTNLIRGVVLIVVVLGIASVLVVSVVQKKREIGILRAMGATRSQIMRLFLLQGALVGAAGSVIGLIMASAMIFLFTQFVRGSDGQPLFVITLQWGTAWRVAAMAVLCGVLAAIAPARRAAALEPAQAIRL